MDNLWFSKVKRVLKRRLYRLDRKLIVYSFFLIISAFLWFVNALSKQYTTKISYPVRYINYPESFIPSEKLPSVFELTLSGYGYSLLRYKITTPSEPLIIDLKHYFKRQNDASACHFTLITARYLDIFRQQIGSQVFLEKITPDSLEFLFSKISKRKLPVKIDVTYQLLPHFTLAGDIRYEPAEVMVVGPSVVVDSLNFISAGSLHMSNLFKTRKETVVLENKGNLEITPRNVKVIVPVERITESELMIQVDVINVAPGVSVHIFPKKVKIVFRTGLSRFRKISPADFKMAVDYNDIKNTASKKVEVQLLKKPDGIDKVSIIPHSVEYLIEKE